MKTRAKKDARKTPGLKNKATHFPGDPRYGVTYRPTRQDISALGNDEMLIMRLLDCIIQRAAPPPAQVPTQRCEYKVVLGGLAARQYMDNCYALVDEENIVRTKKDKVDRDKKIEKIRSRLENVFDLHSGCVNRLIIPVVEAMHYFVFVLDFNPKHKDVFINVDCYDSMQRVTRAGAHVPTALTEVVAQVNDFLSHFVMYGQEHKHFRLSHFDVLDKVKYRDCPVQKNGIDCGLFCIGVVLHLLDGLEVKQNVFTQKNISELRLRLSDHFTGAQHNRTHEPTSKVVRDCFPSLRGTTIVSEYGVEDVTPLSIATDRSTTNATTCTTTKSKLTDNALVGKSDDGVGDPSERSDAICADEYEDRKLTPAESLAMASASTTNSEDTASTASVTDKVFQEILREQNIDAFGALEDIDPLVEEYEEKSGNQLGIKRSERNLYRLYVCKEHLNCTYEIFVGRRRGDGMFSVKRVNGSHTSERRDPRALGGRRHKKRRAHKLDEMIDMVRNTKKERPTPADIILTAKNNWGKIVTYGDAYRALNHESGNQSRMQRKSFELIVPYIEELVKLNADSIIGCERDAENHVTEIYVFPGFMNGSLSFVRPVVSLDAAHLRSVHKGTLYVASVLSGANEVFPIGFMISMGNEDGPTWSRMLTHLRDACPILSEQGFDSGSVIDGEMDGEFRSQFVFMSDRDKGLKPALREIFPRNLAVSCARHIQANVKAKFGQQCARYVIQIAKTFSSRSSDDFMDRIRIIKPSAAEYLENVEDVWRSTDWMDGGRSLPPRYGIVTSNTSECVNNMFEEARDRTWLEAVERIVDIMSTRIAQCRMKHMDREPSEVVPRVSQIVKLRWDSSARISVIEIERGGGDFKAMELMSGRGESVGNDEEISNMPLVPGGGEHSVHIVKPNLQWCSCGVWQDFQYPCRHACAVFRKWNEKDFQYVLQHHVHKYYKFEYVQKMFRKNIFPVCVDNIKYDRATKPPIVRGRQSGRPQQKRIRHRSEYIRPEDSIIKCSQCGERGHNKRTCKNQRDLSMEL